MELPMTLRDFLIAILSGGLALGPMIFLAIEKWDVFKDVRADYKRVAVFFTSMLLGLVAWVLSVWLGYVPGPEGRTAIAEGVWAYGVITGASAFTGSTILHGLLKLAPIVEAKAWEDKAK